MNVAPQDAIDVEEDPAESLAGDLVTKNQKRYESQADQFILSSSLEVEIDSAILRYSMNGAIAQCELSYDHGQNFRWLHGSRLEPGDSFNATRLLWLFAFSEARAILER